MAVDECDKQCSERVGRWVPGILAGWQLARLTAGSWPRWQLAGLAAYRAGSWRGWQVAGLAAGRGWLAGRGWQLAGAGGCPGLAAGRGWPGRLPGGAYIPDL